MAAVVMGACTTTTDPVPIATISLQPQFDSVELGRTYNNWVVTLKDAAGGTLTGRKLSWESNNTTIATIDANSGVVTAVGAGGDALITVRAEGKFDQATIKVLQPVIQIVATPKDSFDLPMTTTRTIAVTVVGPDGVALTGRVITWSSANPGIAVVSSTGVVTPVSLGTTTITIRVGTKQDTVRVRVVGEPVSSVRITPLQSVHFIGVGQSKQLTAECLSASQQILTGRTITWNSLQPNLAAVDQTGLVTGLAIGTATIEAICDNTVKGNTSVQVTP
jgi:uncharacterized protein YjdB